MIPFLVEIRHAHGCFATKHLCVCIFSLCCENQCSRMLTPWRVWLLWTQTEKQNLDGDTQLPESPAPRSFYLWRWLGTGLIFSSCIETSQCLPLVYSKSRWWWWWWGYGEAKGCLPYLSGKPPASPAFMTREGSLLNLWTNLMVNHDDLWTNLMANHEELSLDILLWPVMDSSPTVHCSHLPMIP